MQHHLLSSLPGIHLTSKRVAIARASQGHKDRLVHKDQRVIQEIPVLPVLLVPPEIPALLVRLVLLAFPVRLVRLVLPAPLALPVRLVLPDRRDLLVQTGGLAEYGYIYNTGAQTVAINADVLFDTNGILTSGITHTPGTSQITIANAGNYKVSFSVSGAEFNQFALMVNGVPAAETVYGSGDAEQQNNGQAIIALAAGDVLTLQNHSSNLAITLQTLAGGTQTNVNASIIIEKLG